MKVIMLSIVGLMIAGLMHTMTVKSEAIIKVQEKGIVINESNSYLVFSGDETFSLHSQYNKIKKSKCYVFKLRGVRAPVFSMYRNIEAFDEIDCKSNNL